MAILVGAVLAIGVGLSTAATGMDRDRALYPVMLLVIASYYALFAVMGGSGRALVIESIAICVFAGVAMTGFRVSLWLVVVGLAAHGIFDGVHDRLIANPGVPAWWPAFCLAFDLVAAAFLAWRLASSRVRAAAARNTGAAK